MGGGANKVPYGRCASGVYTVSYLVPLCLKISNTFIDLSTHQVEENPGNDRLNVNGARTYESHSPCARSGLFRGSFQ